MIARALLWLEFVLLERLGLRQRKPIHAPAEPRERLVVTVWGMDVPVRSYDHGLALLTQTNACMVARAIGSANGRKHNDVGLH
jgi:hypothetical protein